MNQKNFDYLKDQLKYTGFGDSMDKELASKMEKQTISFQLFNKTTFGKDETAATLHFKKSDQSDMYFLNKYDLSLKQPGKDDLMKQTFYMGKENNYTLKEAYNLMSGRAVNKDLVNKDGEKYNAWVQLNFKDADSTGNFKLKHFNENYGFDLQKVLANQPLKELQNDQNKTRLTESLQRGNRQSVTFVTEGGEQKRFIEANPQFKSLNIYDDNMQRIQQSYNKSESKNQEAAVKQENKKEVVKKSETNGEPAKEEPKTKRSKGVKIS